MFKLTDKLRSDCIIRLLYTEIMSLVGNAVKV